ncbi:MAG: radical SAM protein [Polyangiaceae bacterium]
MHVALVYPPSCDPTAPYLAIPTLTGYLRAHGVEVVPIDANLEAWEFLLTKESLFALGRRISERLAAMDAKRSLTHEEQLVYASLWRARGDAGAVPHAIEKALATMRDKKRFYDAKAYEDAVATIDAAQRVVSAAHAPLHVDFVAYRTPFSLLDADEIARDAAPERNPYHAYYETLCDRVEKEGIGLVGVSVAFPGQIQPAYSLAHALRRRFPGLHVTVGGPALTQMFLRLSGDRLEKAIGPFSSAVIYEGEYALLELVRALEKGEDPCAEGRLLKGRTVENMGELPPPDFEGLPLDRYLSPELVLPYDPSRGCYWGVCTFCHYGLAEVGTARYRERPVDTVLDHLEGMSKKHGTKVFYFSQDVFAPRVALAIARGIRERRLDVRWGTDMRPEKALSPEKCRELVEGGALSAALGIESANPRVLSLIDKGIPAEDVKRAVENLSTAGVAVEAMCFSDFPTETYREAMETVKFVKGLKEHLSLFILGRFDLTHGALIAQKPGEFGIKEVWQVEGDEMGTGLFFAEKHKSKRPEEQERLEQAVHELSGTWRLSRYPWAGALSTAHTMLHYREAGKDVFRTSAHAGGGRVPGARPVIAEAAFDVLSVIETAVENEAAIWDTMVQERRKVSRADYEALARALPRAERAPGTYRVLTGEDPERIASPNAHRTPSKQGAPRRKEARGRRPSHAHNSTKA